ncbi:Alpha/Beta hydrolase protein [Ochromonadaceae sp. CCMP2298]|nr:Alpha/Beta hydrolase protein [Ochromonadaceae sp. CCMP2298]
MSDTVPSSSLISWLFFGSKVVGGLVATLVAILYVNQEKMLYMPNPPGFPKTHMENPPGFQSPGEWSTSGRHCSPGSADAIEYEEHFVTTKDGVRIHTWLMLHKDSEDRPTLIYFHGNAGNMGFRLKNAALMFAKSEINVLMMDYRGYGSSEGTPTELGLMQDAEAVLLYALQHPRLKNSRMVAFGRSLGGAVAISLAQAFPDLVSGVVVENTFLSVSDMVDVVLPILSPIKSLVLFMKWHSYLKIQELSMPTLFISGDQDQLVPPSHMRRLFELARGEKEFYSVAGGTHNDTFEIAGVEYYRRLRQFMRQQVRARTGPEAQAHAMAIAQAQTQAQEEKQPQAQAQAVVGVGVDGEEGYEIIDSDVGPASALPSLPTMDKGFGVK